MGSETDQGRHEGKKYGEWYLRHDPNQAPLPGTRPDATDGTRPADGTSASRQVSMMSRPSSTSASAAVRSGARVTAWLWRSRRVLFFFISDLRSCLSIWPAA